MRTAAIVGTASVVGGSVAHHQQQKYAAQDAQAAGRGPACEQQPQPTSRRLRRRPPQTIRRPS